MPSCEECYIDQSRITPLLNPTECLQKHTQYICGTCGRCICIEHNSQRGLQRWNFPFRSLEIAKMYLRAADYTMKKPCGIYEINNQKGRISYKIFAGNEDLQCYLKKNKDKFCESLAPIYCIKEYYDFPNTQVRKLNTEEIQQYLSER